MNKTFNSLLRKQGKLFVLLLTFTLLFISHRDFALASTSAPYYEISSIPKSRAEVKTYYFMNGKEFSFTNSNTGNIFNVPRQCSARMVIGVVAQDASPNDFITIEIVSTGGTLWHTVTVPTNKSQLILIPNIGGGETYLRYYGNRYNMRYNVRISLYTWDY